MKEPKTIIMQSWIEPTRQVVPDPAERCRVWEYVFAESMRLAYGIEHTYTAPEGVAAAAVEFLRPQVERLCRAYAARGAQIEAKRGQQPSAGESVPAHAHTENYPPTRTESRAENQIKANQIKSKNKIPLTPLMQGGEDEERKIFVLGLEMIERGKRVQADELRNAYYNARAKAAAGEVRNEKGYICACLKTNYTNRAEANAVANFLRVADIGKPESLEVEGIEVQNSVCTIICTKTAAECIEQCADDAERAAKVMRATHQVGGQILEYRTPEPISATYQPPTAEREGGAV